MRGTLRHKSGVRAVTNVPDGGAYSVLHEESVASVLPAATTAGIEMPGRVGGRAHSSENDGGDRCRNQ